MSAFKKIIQNKCTADFENDRLRRKLFRAGSSGKLGQEQKQMNYGGVHLFFLLPLQLLRNNSIGNACYAGYEKEDSLFLACHPG